MPAGASLEAPSIPEGASMVESVVFSESALSIPGIGKSTGKRKLMPAPSYSTVLPAMSLPTTVDSLRQIIHQQAAM